MTTTNFSDYFSAATGHAFGDLTTQNEFSVNSEGPGMIGKQTACGPVAFGSTSRGAIAYFKRALLSIGLVASIVVLAPEFGIADPPAKPPCGTNGPLGLTMPSDYTYVQPDAGDDMRDFTVSSPNVQVTGACDGSLDPVFGNGSSGDELPVEIAIKEVFDVTGGGSVLVGGALLTEIEDAVGAFSPASFDLTPPGTGTQIVSFTFTNSSAIPVGVYDVVIEAKPAPGSGVGAATTVFTFEVTEPTSVDTLPPIVEIQSPTTGANYCLNADLDVDFTAVDPEEGGAGTGVTEMRADIASTGGFFTQDITGDLTIVPSLPVLAGVTATASASVALNEIGSFLLTAEADDGASHTGSSSVSFGVTVNVAALPPISVAGRQFKVGSTLPVKFALTDCDGLLLPPFESIRVEIYDSTGLVMESFAGDGASNIRWELDEFGNATQYITNFQIPATDNYTVKVYIDDVDESSGLQGMFTFVASTKGGKL